MSPRKINLFLMFKLPSAYFCGVRVKYIDAFKCDVKVRHKWINQNPFNSLYFAVQAMAAELSTGALVMSAIRESQQNISMLVVSSKSSFSKKAVGQIIFSCENGQEVIEAIQQTIATGEGVNLTMKSVGTNEKGEQVSEMYFDWSIRVKTNPQSLNRT